ncbi:hypothetical protein [Vulgatibacter sp.]|uniref:hypothetical protein n=1 Tax=Vulgatibacter sp. TaxID=1971226 RepID=UPI00356A6BBD
MHQFPVAPSATTDAVASNHADARLCSLCSNAVPTHETRTAELRPLCTGCADQLEKDLAAEKNLGSRFPVALAAGIAGALVAAGVWAAIVVFTEYEVGYVAVLVGYLAGMGVKLGAGKARGKSLQITAAALGLFGLVVAKYFIFAHFFAASLAEDGISAGPFDPTILAIFPVALPGMLSPFDLLWVLLALSTAWKVPAASKVALQR